MAPQTAGVKRQPSRQQPELGQDRCESSIIVEIQNGEEVFAPGSRLRGAAMPLEPFARSHQPACICFLTEKPPCDVVQRGRKHGAVRLEMEPEAAVFVLMRLQIAG